MEERGLKVQTVLSFKGQKFKFDVGHSRGIRKNTFSRENTINFLNPN